MTNCIFGWENWALTGTLTASAAVSTLPVSNLATDQGASSSSWQTPSGTTTAWAQVDAGVAVEWGAFGLFNSNLSTAATVRWRVSNSATIATTVYDSGILTGTVAAGYRQSVQIPATAATGRYMRVDIADATNTDGLLRVGHLYAGRARRPTLNLSFSSRFARGTDAPVLITRGGQEYVFLNFARRVWEIELGTLVQADVWTLIQEMQRSVEDGRNMLFVPFPSGTDTSRDALFGRLAVASPVSYPVLSTEYRRWAATITERL